MDKEFIILENIDKNRNITQRELSKKTGLSLGSINLLINKMIKEGLIKIEQIPANRVIYALTPAGMLEKINKTYNYIKIHYSYINETKEKIKAYLSKCLSANGKIYILYSDDEIGSLIKMSVHELDDRRIIELKNPIEITECVDYPLITMTENDYQKYSTSHHNVINIIEKI